jgi:hypothetical protein
MMIKSTKIALGTAILIVVGAGVLCAFMVLSLTKKSAELSAQVVAIAESTAVSEEYKKLSLLLESTTDEREKLQQFILSENEIITFLSEIESISRSFGLLIETRSLNVVPGENNFDTLELELSFAGEEQQVFKFLQFIERLPYASTIAQYGYTNERDGGDGRNQLIGTLKLQVQLHTYE